MTYVATLISGTWTVMDLSTGKTVETVRGGRAAAERSAIYWNASLRDRRDSQRSESRRMPVAPKVVRHLPRLTFRSGRAVWAEAGSYSRMPL